MLKHSDIIKKYGDRMRYDGIYDQQCKMVPENGL